MMTGRFLKFLALMVPCVMTTSFAYGEELVISSATSTQQNIFSKIKGPFEKETGIKLVFIEYGKGKANTTRYFNDMISGKSEAAASSNTFNGWVEVMKKEGHEVPSDVTHRIIGKDAMYVVANKDIGVTKLNFSQVADVFSGKVSNWKQVGGKDFPIQVFIYADKPAKNPAFQKLAMEDRKFAPSTKKAAGEEEDVLGEIMKTPGGVGFTSTYLPKDKIQVIETPETIGRPTVMVSRGQPSPKLLKLINFIRNRGGEFGIAQ